MFSPCALLDVYDLSYHLFVRCNNYLIPYLEDVVM